ncbi:MAG: glycoside hydrolase family 15 protein [Kiritimatiellia bacterium]|jgi:oligosaccharide amylase
MPRDIPVGNGNLLAAFDTDYNLREFYFPHVGEENHTEGNPSRFGVWVNGAFSWVGRGWQIEREYLEDSLVTNVALTQAELELRIVANDLVDFHENIYLKKLTVANLSKEDRGIRLFFAHDFNILGNNIGDTAVYRPEVKGLLHYKGARHFLIGVYANKKYGIDLFAAGNKDRAKGQGTWKDAEDGLLSGNPVAQGSVDSVIGIPLRLKSGEKDVCYYWICAGKNWEEAASLNEVVVKRHPEALFKRTRDYWKLWVNKDELSGELLPAEIWRLYKKSLLICRTQIDNCGSIIAANDSDAAYFNRDTYSYMWMRDASLIAYALDLAGYSGITSDYFNLCAKLIEKGGYFLHKYTPTGSLASSWHPWQKDHKYQLPIQEDETALVIWALWQHYDKFRDIEFIKPLYKALIKTAADFMMDYIDARTGLPLPSYDLWEERQGVFTFTTSAVYGGLTAAADFAEAFGELEIAREYREGALTVRQAMDKHLYLEEEKRFARMVNFRKDGTKEVDATLDARLYGIFAFGAYRPDDEKVSGTMRQINEKLWRRTNVGGLARYENDVYHRVGSETPGNPWFITTLWMAQYHIAAAKDRNELDQALPLMRWAVEHALPSGVLAEQVNPLTNEPLSVAPLTWSHATYVAAVQEYLDKLLAIEKCAACGQSKASKYSKRAIR